MLGRGNYGDDIAEMSGLHLSSVYYFFHEFIDKFATYFADEFIKFPSGDDLDDVSNLYSKIGLPGSVGSMDCTHLEWINCPSNLMHSCKGKEPFASRAFQVVCTHTRLITHCSNYFYGAMNDKSISRHDSFSKWCMAGGLDKVRFIVYDKHGRPRRCRGGHVLVDGGYLKWACFLPPQHKRGETASVYWSECMESVRKDIECVFGILKSRFRM